MIKSRELRWFFQKENDQILKWFNGNGLFFKACIPRTDFYLPKTEKDDIGFKLREGKIELKLRKSIPVLTSLSKNTEGYLEDWVKWSFGLKEDDYLSQSIIEEKKYEWIEVFKERIGLKLAEDENGKINVFNIKEPIPNGCQIEYTKIIVKEQQWFTFCLEWFGEKDLELEASLMSEILGDTRLKKEDSMGYSEFLNLKFK